MRHWNLEETNYKYTKSHHYDVAVLPLGATEPHNLHLPYGTDTFQVEAIASQACERAHRAGASVVKLPAIPYGTETNLMAFPMAMNLNPSTISQILVDLVESLAVHRVHKLLILNGHGGNDIKPIVRELQGQTPVQLFLCDWFRGLTADKHKEIFDSPGDHAGEMETALIMALQPDLVNRDPETGEFLADEGVMQLTRFAAINTGWVSITRPWHLLTSNTGAGNPFPATAAKGHKLLEVAVERLSSFLVELAAAEVDDSFPY